jgi:hypothetical protein
MIMTRGILALLAVALCSCRSIPDEYPPPEQRPSFEGYRLPEARVLNMDDPDAPLHFVRDISPGLAANWRWTDQRPAVRIRVRAVENLKYTIDFTLPQATFKDTGPVTVTFTVNDHVLDRVRYAASGSRHFEKAVPADWVVINKDATVGAEVDKPWVSKEDGVRFGLILTRIGLTR